MTHPEAEAKVKQIIETWEHATNHAPTGEWSADIFLASPEGSRLVGELEEGWVSVKDRTPDIINGKDYSENVLAIVKGHKFLYVMAYCFIVCGEDSGWNWCNCNGDINGDVENDYDYNVTHWQPLPEPPKIN